MRYSIEIPQAKLDYIKQRVSAYPWHATPIDEGDSWARGVNQSSLKELCDYWVADFDWRASEKELNRYPQFIQNIDGLDIHYVHVVGEADGKRPIVLTHGWPSSHFELWDVIERLAYPSKFGGNSTDAFDVVVPSLPGYGFSGKPSQLIGPRATAKLWNTLMTQTLGYKTYIAQGGDFGSLVSSFLALDFEQCVAVHLNMIGLQPPERKDKTDAELAWLKSYQATLNAECAYLQIHYTKPQTLVASLHDSPVGCAAWIYEKMVAWSDPQSFNEGGQLSKDKLLTNIMIYLVNDAITTSIWFYRGFIEENAYQLAKSIEKPTGIANFLAEPVIKIPPRSWVERMYEVAHWAEFEKGGHFAAMEEPQLFSADIQKFGSTIGY